MAWYSHLFTKIPQLVVIHTVKGFSVANEEEVDVFLELPCFFYDSVDVGNLISGSPAILKSSLIYCCFNIPIIVELLFSNLI